MRKSILGVITTIAFATVLTGCGSNQSTSNGNSTSQGSQTSSGQAAGKTITVGTTPLVSSAPIFLAEDLGYWKDFGLDVKIQSYSAAGAIDVATAANSLDVSATGVTASLFNLWNSGKKEYIVADKGRIWPGQHFEALVVNNKAADAGLKSISDLKGKRFGNTAAGSTFDYLLGSTLEKNNLTLKDVKEVPLTTMANISSAVESGQVDAAILPQPAADQVIQSGKAHALLWLDDTMKTDLLVIAYSPNFKNNQDQAVKFMKGYLKAVQFYDQRVYNQKNSNDPEFQKALGILSKYTKQSPNVIKTELMYIDPNAQVDADSIKNQYTFYKKNNFVQGDVDVTSMIDNSFLKAAAQK